MWQEMQCITEYKPVLQDCSSASLEDVQPASATDSGDIKNILKLA